MIQWFIVNGIAMLQGYLYLRITDRWQHYRMVMTGMYWPCRWFAISTYMTEPWRNNDLLWVVMLILCGNIIVSNQRLLYLVSVISITVQCKSNKTICQNIRILYLVIAIIVYHVRGLKALQIGHLTPLCYHTICHLSFPRWTYNGQSHELQSTKELSASTCKLLV
jgi:hypothetical protein